MIVDRLEKLIFHSAKRDYLGASQLGDPCDRKIYYDMNGDEEETYDYQKNDIFERGHLEEPRIFAHLKRINIHVDQEQVHFATSCGALQAHADAIITDLEDGQKYILEIKTMKQERFEHMVKVGAKESNFQYYIQCQLYMGMSSIPRAILLVRNKNTEKLYEERFEFDHGFYQAQIQRARRLQEARTAPKGFTTSQKPNYRCNWCRYHEHCWQKNATQCSDTVDSPVGNVRVPQSTQALRGA